jgi:hypothetical protein
MKMENAYICGTSMSEDMEVLAAHPEEAAVSYVMIALSEYGGAFAAVWVGRAGQGAEAKVRTCYTVMIPGGCPFETEQFRDLVRWHMDATGKSGELSWNRCIRLLCRTDMGYEETPGIVPITLTEKQTECAHNMTFSWKLAGCR